MKELNSHSELLSNIKGKEKAFLLLYKKGSEKGDCAYNNVLEASKNMQEISVLSADVIKVRDIHTEYKITSVPALLEFENGVYRNVIKGCNSSEYYKAVFDDAVYFAESKNEEKPQKRVTVYSTPTCSWCNVLKTHLKTHRIRFTDIDVSQNQTAAEEMAKRSGQRGVPQTSINGEIIVGFDKAKINRLLEINN